MEAWLAGFAPGTARLMGRATGPRAAGSRRLIGCTELGTALRTPGEEVGNGVDPPEFAAGSATGAEGSESGLPLNQLESENAIK